MKGISRIDSNHTHGWFVRVFRDGGTHSKMFSDGVHGGKEKALKAAQEYKEDYESKHPPTLAASRLRLKLPRNNKSGVVGVSDTHDRSKKGEVLPCFSVSWRPSKNVTRCKKFYYHHYDSREEAFKAAVEFRKARERDILAELNGAAVKEKEKKKVTIKATVKEKELSPTEKMLAFLKSKPMR